MCALSQVPHPDEPCHTDVQSLKLHTIASQINIMFIYPSTEQVTYLGQALFNQDAFENTHFSHTASLPLNEL
jgi:hypothetical protein